ncbi:deoxyguanosinetriphosphate triphosphohydrolase [Piscinibacter sp.]|jgi:dGTPase|uniref:deoxyguanosinetriphosphate triphosphohydrolase n=1 Tax=Piscinibacter sp. TaxID=1903157 RepID=UPI002F4151D9
MLHPGASRPEASRGRRYAEAPAPTRNEFQRDRDRIVHSTAFRRLVYKTQVFLNHEGDLFRTRMTHSLEVAQIGRSIARSVGLHEDLVEAIALAHDLGHTPFGHAGQDALNECLLDARPDGNGFEHNLQSLRVVDKLEERYPAFDGLNLSFETREGILKHCSRRNAERLVAAEPGGVGQRFLDRTQPSLEAQLCNLADEIAYNAHDIDDGVRSGLLTLQQLREVELFASLERETITQFPDLAGRRLLFEVIRRMLSQQIYDVIDHIGIALADAAPRSADEVRGLPPLVAFSESMRRRTLELKRFLRHNLYRHAQVIDTTGRAKQVIRELFPAYLANPAEWPGRQAAHGANPRRVADYIAGMTDRFALREHQRLTGRTLFAPMP